MLLEPPDLQPADGGVGMNRVNVTAEYTDADSRAVKLFSDIIGKARAKLAGRGIDILYSFGQGQLDEIDSIVLKRGSQLFQGQTACSVGQSSVTDGKHLLLENRDLYYY
ncbi:hypothetical protein D3C73_775250 [compost metagenome]